MNNNKKNIIFAGLERKKWRTVGTLSIVAVLSFVILAGTLLIVSLRGGIKSLGDRLGADLMIVPLDYEGGAESILIKGEPSYFYFDKGVLDVLSEIDGIEQMSPQFYLTSSSQGCCDIPVQFIGIDEKTDFSVTPWIREIRTKQNCQKNGCGGGVQASTKEESYLPDGYIMVGSAINVPDDNTLRFFDQHYIVSAKLEETGTGMDQAVFANINTVRQMFESAKAKGFHFTDNIDPDGSISNIMIKVKDGYTVDDVKHNIRMAADGLQIIETKNMTNSMESSLTGFVAVLYILIIMLFVLTFVILYLVFQLLIKERNRIYAVMRTVGATSGQIRGLVIKEAAILSVSGSAIGVILASLVIYPFHQYISSAVHIPYLLPNVQTCVWITVAAFVLSSFSGPLAAYISAVKAGKTDVYAAVREQ